MGQTVSEGIYGKQSVLARIQLDVVAPGSGSGHLTEHIDDIISLYSMGKETEAQRC